MMKWRIPSGPVWGAVLVAVGITLGVRALARQAAGPESGTDTLDWISDADFEVLAREVNHTPARPGMARLDPEARRHAAQPPPEPPATH